MKTIAVVVLHFRSLENTIKCLESVCDMEKVDDLTVYPVVVDNASKEPFPQDIKRYSLPVTLLTNKTNKGFTGGMNTGISHALDKDCDYIMIVNNDTVFDKSFLKHAASYLENEKNGGIYVPKIYFFSGD